MKLTTLLQPDYERYEGLRPIIVHLMRLGYVDFSSRSERYNSSHGRKPVDEDRTKSSPKGTIQHAVPCAAPLGLVPQCMSHGLTPVASIAPPLRG